MEKDGEAWLYGHMCCYAGVLILSMDGFFVYIFCIFTYSAQLSKFLRGRQGVPEIKS